MKLNITLKCGALERSFFVTCQGDNRTFKWLAKVVYHRYTIFVPEADKAQPSRLQQFPTLLCDELYDTFSPPIDAEVSEHVNEGDLVVCHLDNASSSNNIRIKFFLKQTGKSPGRTYAVLSAQTQEVKSRCCFKLVMLPKVII